MDTKSIGERLVALCREGKNQEAVETLYDDNIVSIEAMGPPGMPLESQGLAAARDKNKWWSDNHEVHSAKSEGPFVNGNQFAVFSDYDVTSTDGPQKGQRFQMREVAIYTVDHGKIVREVFLA